MDFDYKELGRTLAWTRKQKNLRQSDIEILSGYQLKQPAVSALERGETRVSVDTLVAYCNVLGIRADTVLGPFLTTGPEEENDDAIVDSYVTQLAKIMEGCNAKTKRTIVQVAEVMKGI